MFQNEALRDFSKPENRQWIESTLQKIKSSFPIVVPAIVNGVLKSDLPVESVTSPSDKNLVVAQYALSTVELADQALEACEKAKFTWGFMDVDQRCSIIERAAELLQSARNELVAHMVLEVGKDFREADADVCEAIDFCRFYAAEMRRLNPPRETMPLPGENNFYLYRPRGTTIAISPWNFPVAILCGLTVAPLVCGNPVIMKPAEQSSGVAFRLYAILREAGVPADALHLLPGKGEVVGAHLVKDPRVHVINFTGSKAVGLEIVKVASQTSTEQNFVKRVVAEMGGKNAVIVDEDADLDEAVVGCLQSAFGFQGQKCSALSRIFIHHSCYDKFKSRFVDAMKAWTSGPADNVANKIGPVIDRESQQRLLKVIERNQKSILFQLNLSQGLLEQGNFVPPTVFESTDPQSELGQQEFFGPLVALFKVESFDQGLQFANAVPYALTGGVYSRTPVNLDKAKMMFEVGNLYLNRSITGALVCRQPFGGFKLSGVGAKAGGVDYLLQFLEPRTITENTMRRGFAPA